MPFAVKVAVTVAAPAMNWKMMAPADVALALAECVPVDPKVAPVVEAPVVSVTKRAMALVGPAEWVAHVVAPGG